MRRGFIKLWRKTLDNPYMKKPKMLTLWVYLLMKANHKERDELFGGKRITCKPGQFTTGRKQIELETALGQSFIQRSLKLLESEHQIEQQTSNVNRLITITNWEEYQINEQPTNNKRTTSEQQVNTLKEYKNDKNGKNKHCVFEELWLIYPSKVGKKDAFRRFSASVNTDKDEKDIRSALKHYMNMLSIEVWRKPKDGCRFFDGKYWRSFIDGAPEYAKQDTKERQPNCRKL